MKAKDKEHLKSLIREEIKESGIACSLNEIDVSEITDMSYLFKGSKFNGDIGLWDVSKVEKMVAMFEESQFNGDISKWNVSRVENMKFMFRDAQFNGDLSQWSASKVKYVHEMFSGSKFNGNIDSWCWSSGKMRDAFGESFEYYKAHLQMIEEQRVLKKIAGVNEQATKINHRTL